MPRIWARTAMHTASVCVVLHTTQPLRGMTPCATSRNARAEPSRPRVRRGDLPMAEAVCRFAK
jgi:hypothetical protein